MNNEEEVYPLEAAAASAKAGAKSGHAALP